MPHQPFFIASLSKANFLHSRTSLTLLFAYLGCGFAIFAICAWLTLEHQDALYAALIDYLFPKGWHRAADIIVDFFFEAQSKVVLAGVISGASLVVTSICLFTIKEKCSAAYEKALGQPNGAGHELPLWMQALEESKLLLLYVTSQMVILAIGYYPYDITRITAEILSILFLAFTFGVDFIAPTLQRHGIKYNVVIRVLLKRSIYTLLWGSVFALPVLYLGKYLLTIEELSLIDVSIMIFGLNLLFLSFAIAAGTYVANNLLAEAKATRPISITLKKSAYTLIAILFICGSIFHSRVFMSIHHKSQALKMHYSIDWKDVDIQSDSWLTLFKEHGKMTIDFPLKVTNPTRYDFELEDVQIIIRQQNRDIAQMTLSQLVVPAETQVTQNMNSQISITGKSLSGFRDLMNGWTAHMQYDVLPGIPLIVKIM